ncbi:FAD/NAD(P)-binding domain-containing protein [Hesseltinella vesiculosa]|uniref:FAD/NAD(P)-binding domain-containing protein n=1 Tax=Hesseltinella vesiculosa TaxID=101127 RepID=A0A1X2GQZ1_9FUNG|nr:FAD/NAD(P)-binding domain-containing protein [Hesseltinella vesiculosa]
MKTIVIVGGGYAGIGTARALEKQQLKDVRVILIDKKTHFYHCVAGLRGAIEDWDNQIFIPYDKLFTSPNNKVIQASVARFDEDHVYLQDPHSQFGTQIAYDFLVLATGTRYPAPARVNKTTLKEGQAELQAIRRQLSQANHVLIVGGGPVGVEMAGEIVDHYSDKKVTLVHSQPQLGSASYMPLKVSDRLQSLLKESKVQLSLDDSVTLPPVDQLTSVFKPTSPLPPTKKNVNLEDVDLVVLAFGNRPEATVVKASYPELIQSNHCVKVLPTLQVDHPLLSSRVFVIGDVADLQETKLAFRTAAHASIAAGNIARLIASPNATLKDYKKSPDLMLVTYGKSKGVAQLPFGMVGGNWMAKTLKAKTLFVERYWKELNQK